MTSSGIVRRIDELGRIAIPKEIRRSLKIKEGDPLEMFLDKDKLTLIKYAPEDDKQNAIDTLNEWLKNTEQSTVLTDIERMTFKMLLDKAAAGICKED